MRQQPVCLTLTCRMVMHISHQVVYRFKGAVLSSLCNCIGHDTYLCMTYNIFDICNLTSKQPWVKTRMIQPPGGQSMASWQAEFQSKHLFCHSQGTRQTVQRMHWMVLAMISPSPLHTPPATLHAQLLLLEILPVPCVLCSTCSRACACLEGTPCCLYAATPASAFL